MVPGQLLASAVFAGFLSLARGFADFGFLVIGWEHPSAVGLFVITPIGGVGVNLAGVLGGHLLAFNFHFCPPLYLPYCRYNSVK
jgi:hypothetical protein